MTSVTKRLTLWVQKFEGKVPRMINLGYELIKIGFNENVL